jgi:hypothetical protein
MLKQATALAVIMTFAACSGDTGTAADEASPPAAKTASAEETGRTAGYNPDRNAYFGDLHIHTRSSFDAYIFNVRRTADDAYRFALGETIQHPSGFDMTIAGGPLDFYTVTDHAEYLGILPAMDTPGTKLSELPRAKDMFSTDPEKITAAFQGVGASVRPAIRSRTCMISIRSIQSGFRMSLRRTSTISPASSRPLRPTSSPP